MNDFYCGDHLLLNMQDNVSSHLKRWEKIESRDGKLGRENVISWNRKNESAVFCLLRSISAAFGPEAREDCGRPAQFESILGGRKNLLISYRGNRFNVPFKNASAVLHHRADILRYTESLDSKESNQLLAAIEADLKDPIIMGGVLAMALVEKMVTTPLLKLVDSKNIHILDSTTYFTQLRNKLQKWGEDPSEILDGSSVLFDDFPPTKDDTFNSMFSEDISAVIHGHCRNALMLILIVCLLVVERALYDHLPGGKYALLQDNDSMRKATETVPLNNKSAEWLFSGLDRLKRSMPNSLSITLEGILLWAKNRPSFPPDKLHQIIKWAMKEAAPARRAVSARRLDIKEQVREDEERRKQQRNERLKKKAKEVEKNLAEVYSMPGGVCRSKANVVTLMKSRTRTETAKRKLLKAQIRYKVSLYQDILKDHQQLTMFSEKGKPYTSSVLKQHLISIIEVVNAVADVDHENDDLPLATLVDLQDEYDDNMPLLQLASFTPEDDLTLDVVHVNSRRQVLFNELKEKVELESQKHKISET